jgi:predicted metal-dependent hydrolase
MWEFHLESPLSAHVIKDNSNKIIRSGMALQGNRLVLWYKDEASFFLKPRAAMLASKHNFKFAKISTREACRRWGSCSSKGNISLNSKLILAPEWVSDAIILHELTHTIHHNHGKEFWLQLRKTCPQWNEANRWLKENYDKIRTAWG